MSRSVERCDGLAKSDGVAALHEMGSGAPFRQRGGARLGPWNWTWPFASLAASPDHLVVTVACWRYSFDSSQISSLTIGRALFSKGLEIDHLLPEYPTPFIFWSFAPEKLAEALPRLGFTVQRARLSVLL